MFGRPPTITSGPAATPPSLPPPGSAIASIWPMKTASPPSPSVPIIAPIFTVISPVISLFLGVK